jgi:hypothetical protein
VWSGVFLLLSAADHLLVVLPRINAYYNRQLCLNRNPFRWAEYSGGWLVMLGRKCERGRAAGLHTGGGRALGASMGRRRRHQQVAATHPAGGNAARGRIAQPTCARTSFRCLPAVSASLMSVMIAQLCGVTDIHLLFTLAALMGSTMLFGHLMETANGARIPTFTYTSDPKAPPAPAKAGPAGLPPAFITDGASGGEGGEGAAARVDWTPFVMGCWPFLAVELVTACFFFQAVSNGDPPDFVW